MIKLYLLMIFLLILYPVLSGECIPFENFCSECSQETGLCSKCSYDVFLPDEEGGCTIGNKHCSQGKNYCEKCSESDYKCQICEEGYFPDKNGGCSFTENCSISYNGSCKICDKNYILIDLGNKYLDCVSIFSEELLNCKEYTPKGKCIECETNYYLSYGEKKCTNTDNCFSSISGVCNQCVNYYYLDKSDDYKCKLIPDNSGFRFCKETEDGENCSTCKDGYYFTDEKICQSINYCSQADNLGNYCKRCKPSYYLASDSLSCVSTENCLKGKKDLGICNLCKKGFYLDSLTGDCISNQLDNEFKYCYIGSEKCEKCIDYFYLDKEYICSTSLNCLKSENGICIECLEKYYLGSLDNKCTATEKCIQADSSFSCIECEQGYFYNQSDFSCISEELFADKFKNCRITDIYGQNCQICRNGYYLNLIDKLCYSNEEEGNFYKCSETNENGDSCALCSNNYYLGSLDNKCSSIVGCASSETANKCIKCEENLCFNHKKGTCEFREISNEEENKICYKCIETNEEGTKCELCQEGFFLSDSGYCIDIENCIEEKDGQCIKCKQKYFHDGWIHSYCLNQRYGCIKGVLSGCLRCEDETDFSKCSECFEGYYLHENYKKCYECKPGCQKCTNSEDCGGICLDGFFTIKQESEVDGFDTECGECSFGCKKCDNENYCKECFNGYFLTNEKSEKGDLECYECPYACKHCENENYCLECEDGYELSPTKDDKIICALSNL